MKYPEAKAEPLEETIHGKKVADPYRWMENAKSPKVQRWVDQENRLSRSYLDAIAARKKLKSEFTEYAQAEAFITSTVRKRNGGWRYFQYRRRPGDSFYILYYRDGIGEKPRVAIDPNTFSKDGTKSLLWAQPSWDGRYIAYAVAEKGGDRAHIYILDLENKRILPDSIPPIRYSGVAWLRDNSGFYYTKWPEPGHHEENDHRLYFHRLGTDAKSDSGIFGQGMEPGKFLSIMLSDDDRYLIVTVWSGWKKSEILFRDLSKKSELRPLTEGTDAKFAPFAAVDGRLYALTDHKAPNYKAVHMNLKKPGKWETIIPAGDAIIEEAVLVGDSIVVKAMKDVSSVLKAYTTEGKLKNEIRLPGMGTVPVVFGDTRGEEVLFDFGSFGTPRTAYRYDLKNSKLEFLEQIKYGREFKNIEMKFVRYKSKDGAEASMFIVHRKSLKLDGANPALIYGYGGYGATMTPFFDFGIMPFINGGGVYAMTHLRGGGEYGEEWHKAGMLERKQNTFDDFIAAAEWLIANKYTRKDRLASLGGSNGGLLVAACMVQKPGLFRAVVCSAPVIDMIRYHKVAGGSGWVYEYGSPDNAEEFEYLIKYSPYHNFQKGVKYPSVLFMSAENDTRVDPMHARKMAALMQKNPAQKNPILIYTEKNIGHGFGKPLSMAIEDMSDQWAFVYKELGLSD